MEHWSHDGVRLELAARPMGPSGWRWLCALAGVTLGSWFWLVADPAPPAHVDCASLHDAACAERLPAEVQPHRPSRAAWVLDRSHEVLEGVRRADRLPNDVHALAALDLAAPGPREWEFLGAEGGDLTLAAIGVTARGPSAVLERELAAYRSAQRGRSVHFSEATRFVAELNAARVLEPEDGRALVDELIAASPHAVLDLGEVPSAGLLAAASALADAEWVARRHLEQARWAQARGSLQRASAEALRAWTQRQRAALAVALLGTLGLSVAEGARRRRTRPVHLEVDARGIGIDGSRTPRADVVWLGLRDGRLRVVTRAGERLSRPVADERGLARVVRAWRDLRATEPEDAPADVDRLHGLVRGARR